MNANEILAVVNQADDKDALRHFSLFVARQFVSTDAGRKTIQVMEKFHAGEADADDVDDARVGELSGLALRNPKAAARNMVLECAGRIDGVWRNMSAREQDVLRAHIDAEQTAELKRLNLI